MNNRGKVALVGAGPGDDGLITVKGKALIEQADVIIYDHLANASLHRFAKPGAEIIYAGKKSGVATYSQNAINRLLIEKASEGKRVVRLKGGDPFIFGRGGEEAVALREAGVPFCVVPGVSSPIGVSAYAGIPLTHRDYASNVSIITGSNEKGKDDLPIEWENMATRSGTLVFLMGARKLKQIVENLIRYGKPADTPIAVIQWGTTPRQKTWTGTLATLLEEVDEIQVKPPALTIIGDVVRLKKHIDWYESLPLFGKTVLVTRAEDQAGSFLESLQERGAEALSAPAIEMVGPEDFAPLDEALTKLGSYDGVIFTSVNGVHWFIKRLHEKGLDIRELKGVKIYAIGPKTGEAVEQLGIRVDGMPDEFVAESLLKTLGEEPLKGKRFLLPRAAVARNVLPDQLRELGAHIDVTPAYRTLRPQTLDPQCLRRLYEGTVDVVTFTSSSTVTHFLRHLGDDAESLLQSCNIACIGPITAQTARDAGLKVDVIAPEYTVDGLIRALEDHYSA